MKTGAYTALVEVFRGSRWEAEIVKGLLNTAGVESILKDESLSLVTSPYLNTGDQVAVLVNPEEEVYARKVVAEKSA
ncbi:MAG: DUF2007-related protein [Bacteroidales bacterium]|nr:DUF2007-related protein [Bacteroidales bacterium]